MVCAGGFPPRRRGLFRKKKCGGNGLTIFRYDNILVYCKVSPFFRDRPRGPRVGGGSGAERNHRRERRDERGRTGREKIVSAEKASEKARARIPEENGYQKRPQGFGETPCEGQKNADVLTETLRVSGPAGRHPPFFVRLFMERKDRPQQDHAITAVVFVFPVGFAGGAGCGSKR